MVHTRLQSEQAHTHTHLTYSYLAGGLHKEGQATNLGRESRISMKPSVGVRL